MKTTQLVYLLPLIGLWHFASFSQPVTMIAIATTLFIAIKAHTLLLYFEGARTAKRAPAQDKSVSSTKASFADLATWFGFWWGLKPADFFPRRQPEVPSTAKLIFIAAKILIGIVLISLVAPTILRQADSNRIIAILGGWVGMLGIVFCMHFGYSHLSAVLLRSQGRLVTPIMNAPILAASVSEFWGKRWNLAFRDYAHKTLFVPMAKRFGGTTGAIAGFLFSGIIHELAISVPARAGFGWPMLYFLIQGLAVIAERALFSSGTLVAGSIKSRLWTIATVAVPAPLLFHQAFVIEVINPILGWCDLTPLLFGS